MTLRKIKYRTFTKRRTHKIKSKKHTKRNLTKRNLTKKYKYGGDISLEYKEKNAFRRAFNNSIIQIKNKKNIKQAIKMLIQLFQTNKLVNTLIPVTKDGRPIDKETYSLAKKPLTIYDFVSPITVLFDNLTDILSTDELIQILEAYYKNSGNFNNASSRFKETPFQHEVDKQRIDNIRILLNHSYPFHIMEEGLNSETKQKLAELIPNEARIGVQQEQNISNVKLMLPHPLPNNETGYDRTTAPEFWQPIFQNGEELLEIREKFMGIYELDHYVDNTKKELTICNLLETIIPGYMTKYTLSHMETAKTLVNTNIANCFITLFYGMLLYRLYDTKQDYLFIFKGGRALQLSLVDIVDIGKYFSEDADILIIPNKFEHATYELDKMENLSQHIAYLVKWMMPEDIHIYISLPTNPKNQNKDITKLLYNDDKLFKGLSDIGFGEINKDIQQYFEHLSYSPIYIDQFETVSLFITPTLDDMLFEKLFYYSKYFKFKQMLERKEPINEDHYTNLTIEECNFLLYKFSRAIKKLLEAIIKRDHLTINPTVLVKQILEQFMTYTSTEIGDIVVSLYPPQQEIVSPISRPLRISTVPLNAKI